MKTNRQARRERATEVARAFAESGLTRRSFAAREGISAGTLDNYRRIAATGANLMEVEVAGSARWPGSAGLTLVLGNGRRIEIGDGFETATLERLLPVAEGR